MDQLIIDTVFKYLFLTHTYMHILRERQGERLRVIETGGPSHRWLWSAECQLSDPAYWLYVLRTPFGIRTQKQYPDDYRVAGMA